MGEEVFCVATKVSVTDRMRDPLCTPAGRPSRILHCSGSLESLTPFLFLLTRDSKIWSLAIEDRESNYQVFKIHLSELLILRGYAEASRKSGNF